MKNLLCELDEQIKLDSVESRTFLHDFLFASMDESRVLAQHNMSKSVLEKTDMDDWEYFRHSIVKREIDNIISYEKQRDHAAHTAYNYLLGNYIYKNSAIYRTAIDEHSQLRSIQDHLVFESLWPFVSLLHDVGYMFEGSISNMDIKHQSELIALGVDILNGYFQKNFWNECGIDSVRDMDYLLKLADIHIPRIDSESIYSITNSLRDCGNLSIIVKNTNRILKEKGINEIDDNISFDAFDIWISNLEYHNRHWSEEHKNKVVLKNPFPSMINRITELQKYFSASQTEGLKKISVRNIDHAVASGLILLKCSTFYFQISSAIEISQLGLNKPNDLAIKRFQTRETSSGRKRHFRYDSEWWWLGITWATMAAAYHNFPLMEEFWPGNYKLEKISLEDDPLTFLGILVDVLQEWDRFSSSNESLSSGKYPLQGADVNLGTEKNEGGEVIVISYPDYFDIKKLEAKLDKVLTDWRNVVLIKQHHIETIKEKESRKSAAQIKSLLDEKYNNKSN